MQDLVQARPVRYTFSPVLVQSRPNFGPVAVQVWSNVGSILFQSLVSFFNQDFVQVQCSIGPDLVQL